MRTAINIPLRQLVATRIIIPPAAVLRLLREIQELRASATSTLFERISFGQTTFSGIATSTNTFKKNRESHEIISLLTYEVKRFRHM
jgi:hypothetical protein